jgi:quercetin dioxygenase-like cupin family protein
LNSVFSVDFDEFLAVAGDRKGVIWALEGSGDLVRFDARGGVGEHLNDEVDVLFVGVVGSGSVRVYGEEYGLDAGKLVFVPRGARRSTLTSSYGFAYLTLHRRRGPLNIGDNL